MVSSRSIGDRRLTIKLQVNFGEQRLDNMGFTEDISGSGVFIKTAVVFPANTEIGVELTLPEGEVVRLKGIVNWSKAVPPNLVWATKDAGMGVKILKFIQGQDDYYRVLLEGLGG